VRGVIDVLFQRINRLPRLHVDEDSVIIIRPEIGGVTCGGLKPPDKAGAGVSQGIDFIQPGDKSFHHGIFEWGFDPSDIDLGYVVCGHWISSPQLTCREPIRDP